MSSPDAGKTILEHFPKAVDCINGHIGSPVTTLEQECDDDRCWDIKVTRCSHCGIPLGSEYA